MKTSVGKEKAKAIYERLDPKLKEIFREKAVLFHRLTDRERRELCGAFINKEFDRVSRIVERSLLPKESLQKPPKKWEALKGELGSRAIDVDDKGASGKTTNPVLFYSSEGKLSTYVPKELVGVMKSRLSKGIDYNKKATEIYRTFLELGYKVGNPPPREVVSRILKDSFPEVYSGYIPRESEVFESQIIEAFSRDISGSVTGYKRWRRSSGSEVEAEDPTIKRARGSKGEVLQEIEARGVIPRGLEDIRDRYINTALFAKELDEICGTELTPRLADQEIAIAVKGKDKQEMRENLRGIFQEKMIFVPLGYAPKEIEEKYGFSGKNEATTIIQRTFDLVGPLLDTNSFQRAVIRSLELGDADFHSGNVALVPKFGERILPEITRLNPVQMQIFLEALAKARDGQGVDKDVVDRLKMDLISAAMKKVGASETLARESVERFLRDLTGVADKDPLEEAQIAAKILELAGQRGGAALRFEILIFDVDLTMPRSNAQGVTDGIPPVRNVLMAFPKANEPLAPGIREELKMRGEYRREMVDAATRRFDEETAAAFRERLERLAMAGEEEIMTPRGLVWRTFPAYAEAERAYDVMMEVDEAPNIPFEKYEFIGFQKSCNGLADVLRGYGLRVEAPTSLPLNL